MEAKRIRKMSFVYAFIFCYLVLQNISTQLTEEMPNDMICDIPGETSNVFFPKNVSSF